MQAVKKSPRAPSIPLQDALERALKAYDRERLHEAPTEVVAQNIGYKNANSGTALSAIASLRYFGLLVRPKNGFLAVSKEVEAYRFSPDESQKRALLVGFLTSPPLFKELLQKYESGLPSDATLKYDLIQRGFIPSAAEATVTSFRQSVNFSAYFELNLGTDLTATEVEVDEPPVEEHRPTPQITQPKLVHTEPKFDATHDQDKIPVRLTGGRRAWLVIPTPFYNSDKARLRAQIELLLTEDEEE